MQNKVIKFAGLTVLFALIIALAVACKVESAAPSDDTSGGGGPDSKPITVTVDGGTSYTVASDGTADVPSPTKTGYDFLGWTKTKDGTTVDFVRNSTKVTTSITIYPIWDTALSSKIKFTKDFTTLHSFQYQVVITDLKAATNLEFIASSSATDPGYDSIKTNGAKLSAYFTPTFLKRGLYFSYKNGGTFDTNKYPELTTTGDYNPTSKNYIDLKAKTGQAQVQSAIEAVSPALLSPGGTYYIHVYRNGTHVTSSSPITLPYYPTTWPIPVASGSTFNVNDYLLGRSDFQYSSTSDKSTNTTIEVNDGINTAISISFVFPVSNPINACGQAPSVAIVDPTNRSFIISLYPNKINLGANPKIVFAPPTNYGSNYDNASTDIYNVFDIMYLVSPAKVDWDGHFFYNSISCVPLSASLIDPFSKATAVNMKVYDK